MAPSVLDRNLIFVCGKGGVGKTSVSQAIALTLSKKGRKTLWAGFEDPLAPPGELKQLSPTLWHLNCEAIRAFDEYIGLKIKIPALTKLFLSNKLIRYLSQAAPGIRDLVLLGKIWFERNNYDHLVLDLPSTGYGLALFQGTKNFSELFKSGPTHKDAVMMLRTFGSPAETGFLILALPEEMPLREALDLNRYLLKLFPDNQATFLANRLFPKTFQKNQEGMSHPSSWNPPFANSELDYAHKRALLENHNLEIWRNENINFSELRFHTSTPLVEALSQELPKELQEKTHL